MKVPPPAPSKEGKMVVSQIGIQMHLYSELEKKKYAKKQRKKKHDNTMY